MVLKVNLAIHILLTRAFEAAPSYVDFPTTASAHIVSAAIFENTSSIAAPLISLLSTAYSFAKAASADYSNY